MSDSDQLIESSQLYVPSKGYWTPQMNRAILDCVDEAAGNNTIFLTDRDAATKKAMEKLRLVTHPDTYAELTLTKIYNKLGKQAALGGPTPGGFNGFLQKGTKCLDLSTLQAGTYSEEEIRARTQSRQDNNNKTKHPTSSFGNAEKKRFSEIEDDLRKIEERMIEIEKDLSKVKKLSAQGKTDEQSSKRLKRLRPMTFSDDYEHAQTSSKRKRNITNPTTHDEISDSQRNAEESDDDYADASETFERNSQGRFVPNTRIRYRSEQVYVCEFCEERFQAKDVLLDHKLFHEKSTTKASTSQSSFQASTVSGMAHSTPGELNILELATSRKGGEHTDVEVIRSTMANIQADIFNATKSFLLSSKIDGNQIIVLQVGSYEESLNELLRVTFGSGPIDLLTQTNTARFPSASALKRREIMLTIIGCAVTEWALRPLPQGEVRDGVLGEMNKLLQAQSPVFQDRMMEMAIYQYLEKHVKPLAQGSAQVFANDLFRLLRHFLNSGSPNNSSHWPPGIHEEKSNMHTGQNATTTSSAPLEFSTTMSTRSAPAQSEPQTISVDTDEESENSMTSEHEPSSSQPTFSEFTSSELVDYPSSNVRQSAGWPPKAQKHSTRILLESLEHIFKSALRLRLEMEMKGNAKYEFRFPLSGTTLNLRQLFVHNKANNRKLQHSDMEHPGMSDNETRRKILVGLTPIIHGRFRKGDRGGEWREDTTLISKGCVHIHDV